MNERPVMYRIEKTEDEAQDTKSFWLEGSIDSKAGQFVMLWVPGYGQRPVGVSYRKGNSFAVTVRNVGKVSSRLFEMGPGERIGIQGPYGRPFSGRGKNVVLVGGGYGTAPLALLAEEMSVKGKHVTLLTGAPNERFLLYRKRFSKSTVRTEYATDDGSFGLSGFTTDHLLRIMEKQHADYVYSCGPEKMMVKVFDICRKAGVPAEFSLERYMKCGIGVCGSCTLDGTGWRVCKDGPVFTSKQLEKVTEFGKYKRDETGRRVSL